MLLLPTNSTPLSEPSNMVLSKVRSWASIRGEHHQEDNNNTAISVKRELLRTPPPSQRCKHRFRISISVDFVHFAPSRVSPPRKERSAMMHNRSKPCAYLDCTRWPSENRVPSVRCYLLQKPRPHSPTETGGYFALRSFLIELLGAGGVFLLEIIIRRGDEMVWMEDGQGLLYCFRIMVLLNNWWVGRYGQSASDAADRYTGWIMDSFEVTSAITLS